MFEVAIIGAGELGGALASMLAERDVVRSVHLIDAAGQVAAGKALDIAQSAAVRGFSTRVTGSPDVTATAGAHVRGAVTRPSPRRRAPRGRMRTNAVGVCTGRGLVTSGARL